MQIEKNIPLPTRRQKYPLRDMQVQDSFTVDAEHGKSVATASRVYGLRNGKQFTVRKEDDHFRVWRTK